MMDHLKMIINALIITFIFHGNIHDFLWFMKWIICVFIFFKCLINKQSHQNLQCKVNRQLWKIFEVYHKDSFISLHMDCHERVWKHVQVYDVSPHFTQSKLALTVRTDHCMSSYVFKHIYMHIIKPKANDNHPAHTYYHSTNSFA